MYAVGYDSSGAVKVWVIDTATNAVVGTISPGGNYSGAVAFSRDGSKAYLTTGTGNAVAVIDTASLTVTGSITVGSYPSDIPSPPTRRLPDPDHRRPPADADAETVDVTVTTPGGTSSIGAADRYTYTFPACSVAKANFRWHYATTTTTTCPSTLTIGPQAMDGALHVTPGTILKAGYDFTVPGNNATQTLSAVHPQAVFTVACVDHSTPTQPTITVTMPSGHYTFTGSAWLPSGDQNSALTYQGQTTVPDLCGDGQISLAQGGTFTTSVN